MGISIKMEIIQRSRHKVSEFPVMEINPKRGQNNSLENLLNFKRKLNETPKHSIVFYYKTGEVEIWFMLHDGKQCMVLMKNTIGSCSICIRYFVSSQELVEDQTTHTFDPDGFLAFVNSFLTKDALKKQIEFIEQEKQEKLNEALKKAHHSEPQTCGGVDKCKYCKSAWRWHQILHGYGT